MPESLLCWASERGSGAAQEETRLKSGQQERHKRVGEPVHDRRQDVNPNSEMLKVQNLLAASKARSKKNLVEKTI